MCVKEGKGALMTRLHSLCSKMHTCIEVREVRKVRSYTSGGVILGGVKISYIFQEIWNTGIQEDIP